ncbi:metallophosphoesterase family protein [Streptomyces sp. BI20]|uniref:metallophosphoesterase family protein n=1 Tax=Streptomyces sp. BI20 TaxID=3403460 RepID=UPI003C788A98
MTARNLLAVSDLHISYEDNRTLTESLRPHGDEDWLIVAGDVGEKYSDIEWALKLLADRFAKVIWSPGNHELWSHPSDPFEPRGVARYERLVEMCRALGVLTPEDPYAVWEDPKGPISVAPLFLLYDYSFRAPGARTVEESLRIAHDAGIVCADEHFLHPDPYPDRASWCRARVAYSEERLAAVPAEHRTVLINHWPMTRHPTRILRHPEFAQWCGTELSADWHVRHRAAEVVYGHLHIPRVTWQDGVRFTEVSVGYPREWRPRAEPPKLRRILPTGARSADITGGAR